jgi:hypothetical protein
MSALLPEGQKRVELDLIDNTKPIIARAGSTEMQLKGLIMPLGERSPDDAPPAKPTVQLDSPSPEAERVTELEAETRRLRDEIALLQQERDAARATVRILEANGRQLVDDRDRLQAELHRRTNQPRTVALTPTTPIAITLSRRERLAAK